MSRDGSLLAWLEVRQDGCLAAFVGGEAYARAPASRLCASRDDARRWIEAEGVVLGLRVKWVDQKALYASGGDGYPAERA